MIRIIVMLFEIVLCFILQTSLFSYIPFSSVVPNCLLVLVISVAYTKGRNKAIVTGFVCGLILDLMSSGTLGICSIIYMIIAYLAGFTNKIYDRNDYIIPGALILVGELLYGLLYYGTGFLLLGKLNLGSYMVNTIIPRIIYTLLSGFFVYPFYLFCEWLCSLVEGYVTND